MRKYNSGTRRDVIRNMVAAAIRDQETLIDAYAHVQGEEAKEIISEAKDWIKDFRRLEKVLAP